MDANSETPEPSHRESGLYITILAEPDENGERHQVRLTLVAPESCKVRFHFHAERPRLPGEPERPTFSFQSLNRNKAP
jgi:hypothetical protein